nr:DEAD-box ATP-dependent RNA helicase 42 [Ipomoea batatas]
MTMCFPPTFICMSYRTFSSVDICSDYRQELLRERERQKEEQLQSMQHSMRTGMAQAMKEQAQLREEMAYQYKLGNFEAAAAIQRRLDPDVAM